MKIKRIKKIKINCYEFDIKWNKEHYGGCFSYEMKIIEIGVKSKNNPEIFMIICHELMEIVAAEMGVRLHRPDSDTDYIFVYDHRLHTAMMDMFSGLISEFIL